MKRFSATSSLLFVLLLLVQLSGPALHALDHHRYEMAQPGSPHPPHHDSSDCGICDFVIATAADLPQMTSIHKLVLTAERTTGVPSAAFDSLVPCICSARAPPAAF